MKSIIRNIMLNALALWLTSLIFQGLIIDDPLKTSFVGGILLSTMNLTVRPILTLVTLPLNLATLGTFSFLINALILYLLTILIPTIQITNFTFSGINIFDVIIPEIKFTVLTGILASSFLLSLITGAIKWLIA